MKNIDLCEAHVLAPFVDCLERRGIDSHRYLERQHIPPELVVEGKGYFIKRQAWNFFRDVTHREGIRSLGFLDGDSFSMANLGALGEMLQLSVTLKDALETFARLVSSFAQGNTIWLEPGREITWLHCRTDRLDPDAFVPDDYSVLVLIGMIRLVEPAWRPLAMGFQSAPTEIRGTPESLGDIQRFYRCDASAIAFPTSFLPRQICNPRNDPSLAPSVSPLQPLPSAEALMKVIHSLLPLKGIPSSEQAAEMVGVSRRTLSRALDAEGTSYRQLVDRVRFQAARFRLDKSALSIKAIANEVGYSSPNNFVRAFKRFTGTTPGRYRSERS